ncbi:hypothetical protein L873DRAFT_1267223 [Choiromyces venosus 120613-1]|uniref:Nucleotidyltransferase n=1 Tax=Choiromyces venosus 120613-1 TaxID=1336337 RepID=A0A3N4JHV6_9PEZI|nr:hypothetical protein L873DRAFT_1267223 [Choiromyces venosus 120613-1]
MEAARAVWDLVGEEHINNFVVVRGAALLFHGSDIRTEDTDLAITLESFDKFCQLARNDPRFTKDPYGGPWRYRASFDFDVLIDFLDKLGVEGWLPRLTGYCLIQGVPIATLSDLALSKAAAWVDRNEGKDLDGLEYVLQMMARTGLSFRGLGEEGKGILDRVVVKLPPSEKGRRILRIMTRLL